MVSALDERAVRVRALAGNIVLCCVLGQDTLLSQCLAPPRCISRRVIGENLTNFGEVTCDGLASRPGEVEILLAASCYRNRDKLQQL